MKRFQFKILIPVTIGLFLTVFVPQISSGQNCNGDSAFTTLNFWVGEWEVYSGDQRIGSNNIEKILDGCAILEHWEDLKGGKGKSLFYYHPTEKRWKQVWVTPNPMRPGGVKEKAVVETLGNGGVRFQGTITTSSGNSYLDRTTLIPLENGDVRQIIEVSSDNGKNWQERFRAVYRKKSL